MYNLTSKHTIWEEKRMFNNGLMNKIQNLEKREKYDNSTQLPDLIFQQKYDSSIHLPLKNKQIVYKLDQVVQSNEQHLHVP